ncbi:hypothetical protein LXL04_006630 [Taraxacum kok-saghyz]
MLVPPGPECTFKTENDPEDLIDTRNVDTRWMKICYVQFPQRFEGIDPSDRYANHNTVFFDVSIRALDGLQGPMYVGTGCIFRRIALYGFSPPRATEHHGWFGGKKIKFSLKRLKKNKTDEDTEMILPIVDDRNNSEEDDELKQALIPEREPIDRAAIEEAIKVLPALSLFSGKFIVQSLNWGYLGRCTVEGDDGALLEGMPSSLRALRITE